MVLFCNFGNTMETKQSNHNEYKTQSLDNGLRIVHKQTDSTVAYIGLAVGVGTRYERRGEQGLAHFTEHMLFKGTPLRQATQIIQRLEAVGGELNAYTSKEETIVYAIVPQAYYYRALQLIGDIVQYSHFALDELTKEQTVVIDEINSYHDSPSELIWDEFEDLLFHRHALGHNILGTERSIRGITRDKQLAFFERHYRADNMVLFVQGNIDFDRLCAQAEALFVKGTGRTLSTTPSLPPVALEPRRIVRRKSTHQRHILVGSYGYSMYDKGRLGLSLLTNLLGGAGMSSRLNMSLRERHGLVYHVECSYTAYSDSGLVGIYLGCSPSHQELALRLVDEELQRISTTPLSDSELEAAKRQLKGQLIVSGDAHEQTFLSMGKHYLHHGRVDSPEEICVRIDALTSEELFAIASEVFAPERMFKLIYQ